MIRSVLAAVVAALVLAAPAGASAFQPGAPGLGDPFFPLAGNGGYDVKHYSLDLDYDAARQPARRHGDHHRAGDAEPVRFNLDLRGFTIAEAEVDGRDAGSRATARS